jgi:hypothetical protein
VKKTVWIGVAFLIVVVAFVVISTFRPQQRYRVRVCMTFNGRTDCRVAAAATPQDALRTAVNNACAQISSGMIQSNQCDSTQPDSVEWLQ